MQKSLRRVVVAAVLCAATTVTGACGSEEQAERQADTVTVHDQWVKAVDTGMTAAFGELTNNSTDDVRVVAASTPASGTVELHEVVSGADGSSVMRPKEGGFVIPAGGTHTLSPGGDHVMLMDVTAPLTPGATAQFTLEFADRSTMTFTAQVRDFAGAQENYQPGDTDASTHGG